MKFVRLASIANDVIHDGLDPITWAREHWERPEWAVKGPRGGRWLASGPIDYSASNQAYDAFMRDETVVRGVRRDARYIRPRDKAAVAHWEQLA